MRLVSPSIKTQPISVTVTIRSKPHSDKQFDDFYTPTDIGHCNYSLETTYRQAIRRFLRAHRYRPLQLFPGNLVPISDSTVFTRSPISATANIPPKPRTDKQFDDFYVPTDIGHCKYFPETTYRQAIRRFLRAHRYRPLPIFPRNLVPISDSKVFTYSPISVTTNFPRPYAWLCRPEQAALPSEALPY
jgi:hypothetical protein